MSAPGPGERWPERAPGPVTDLRAAWARLVTGAAAIAAAFVVAYVVDLPEVSLCTFQAIFGRPCPGCGMTRSITHLVSGDVVGSLRLHPLGIVLFGAALLWTAGGLLAVTRGRDPVWELFERRGVWIAGALIVLLFGLWIVRAYVVPEWAPDPVGEGLGWRGALQGLWR